MQSILFAFTSTSVVAWFTKISMLLEDTPVGLPAQIAKLGAYSGERNAARDFRRNFKPPVDWVSKKHV